MKTNVERVFFLNVIVYTFGRYVGRSVRVAIAIAGDARASVIQQTADIISHKVRRDFNERAFTIDGHEIGDLFDTVKASEHGIPGMIPLIRAMIDGELIRAGGELISIKLSHGSETVSF
jgi:hypothetical protein